MLLDDWIDSPRSDRGMFIAGDGDGWTYRTYTELADAARGIATRLGDSGIRPGSTVVILFGRQAEFAAAFFGTLVAGCTPAPVAPPSAFGKDTIYTDHLTALLRSCAADAVLTDDTRTSLADTAAAACDAPPTVIRVELDELEPTVDRPVAALPDLALTQFTSGSSGNPKGVRVTRDNLCANLTAMAHWMQITDEDGCALWLPHYHDMGLMSILRAVTLQIPLWLMTPRQFIADPLRWLSCLGRDNATLTGGPPFAYAYAARRVTEQDLDGMDFSRWRVAVLGAERIDPATIAEFTRRVVPFGFHTTTLMPGYGMAETTLMTTGVALDAETVIREVTSPALIMGEPVKFGATGILGADAPAGGTWLTSCGYPVVGMDVDIIDDKGQPLPEGYLGEIRSRGTSVAAGYHDAEFNERFAPDGLHTGDSGVMVDGNLFVIGRISDSLKVRGAAVHAEDLENDVVRESGLIPNLLAVLLGTLDLVDVAVLIVNVDLESDMISRLTTLMTSRLSPEVAIVIVKGTRGAIKRTSSGKPRRRVMWQQIAHGTLPGDVVYSSWDSVASRAAPWDSTTDGAFS